LSGPDGAGKTTHARAIVGALQTCAVQTDYVWSRGGSTGLVKLAGRLRRRHPSESRDTLGRRRQRLAHRATRLLWSWLVAADQVATFTFRARLPALLGRVVVLDRYAYDAAVEMHLSLPPDARWSQLAIRVMLGVVPIPQLGYLLEVPDDVARARNPDEVWQPEIEEQRGQYLALARRFDLRVHSTDGSFAETNDRLIREVIMAYMGRFETWLNGLFWSNPSQSNAPDGVWAQRDGA
jgi:thymidylate kinase